MLACCSTIAFAVVDCFCRVVRGPRASKLRAFLASEWCKAGSLGARAHGGAVRRQTPPQLANGSDSGAMSFSRRQAALVLAYVAASASTLVLPNAAYVIQHVVIPWPFGAFFSTSGERARVTSLAVPSSRALITLLASCAAWLSWRVGDDLVPPCA